VVRALEKALPSAGHLDLITFSGNGEPTLYPGFAELVDVVAELRNRYQPNARIALLSNSTGLLLPEVRRALGRIDLPVLKLDAGTEHTFRVINRPASGVHFAKLVELLIAQEDIYIQTVLVDGKPMNVHTDELAAYFGLLAQIKPREVHLYSIDRPVPNANISLVPPDRLEAIAARGSAQIGVPIKAYYSGKQA
jgi:wyosine [tRNA(Phe)-imidazoG37] synthetase (radical SAM superfamily)